MSVEILSVSLSDESIEKLADRVAAKMSGLSGVNQANLGPQNYEQAAPPAQDDPWAGTNAAPAQQYQVAAPVAQQPVQAVPQPMQAGAPGPAPLCAHGPMRHVPSGFSQSTGRAYPAFWGCTTPRGAPDKCKSVPA